MTSPDHLTVRSPEDILGFIPHSLGYWPAQSLVAMTLQGTRLGATLRLDLPGREVLAAPAKFLQAVRRYLAADKEADGTLLAFFTSNGSASSPSPYDGLLAGLDSMLEDAGMPVREAWYVGDDFWREAWCLDVSCCPLPGRPVQQIRDSTLNTEMVYRGSSIGPQPEEQAPALPVSSLYLAAVREAETAWSAQLDLRRASRQQFDSVLRLWLDLLDRPLKEAWLPEADRDGFLRASLLVPAYRDAVLMMAAAGTQAARAGAGQLGLFRDECLLAPVAPQAFPGTGACADGLQGAAAETGPPKEGPPGAGIPGYGDVLMGVAPAVPDWERLNALDLAFGQLAAAGGRAAAASFTGRGWIAWCRGRGSYSAAYLRQALDAEPGYRLAELLLELVRRGTLCGWAARKDAAWQKFGPDAA
ncbi:DUF4192 domain-containing protein [Pseudarthrobacter oxydans]|uniref:DUF4192 family protein n=1 Tax=Pseudarthrobacter oxydans TaxID=1671 RepID=UPI00157381BF|nr:DUF4192 family protein [Pseudarthrobacter oxydans]NSX36305.1 DUF4192 domain-containing protein [Pseudarthrobacter oxydans]